MAKAPKIFASSSRSYKRLQQIGQGGTAVVFEVRRADDDQTFALKSFEFSLNTEAKKRIKNDLAFCKDSQHPNIIQVVDEYSLDGEVRFYVMPYYPSTLRQLIVNGIPDDRVLTYFRQILDGLEFVHSKGIWHRDIKPENILHDSDANILVIADWGIAHFAEEQLQTIVETKIQSRLANFQYAAPEQRIKGGSIDHRADIYALGMLLNEMFTGQLLQGAGYKTIEEVAPDYAYLDPIVERMIQQSPEKRFSSVSDIKAVLDWEAEKAQHNTPSSIPTRVDIESRLSEYNLADKSSPFFGVNNLTNDLARPKNSLRAQATNDSEITEPATSSTIFLAIPSVQMGYDIKTIDSEFRTIHAQVRQGLYQGVMYDAAQIFPLASMSRLKTEQYAIRIEDRNWDESKPYSVVQINDLGEFAFATSQLTVSRFDNEIVFELGAIIHLFWSFLCLVHEMQTRIGYTGNYKVYIALINTKDSFLGSFADDQQSYDALKGVSLRGVRSLEQFEMVCTEQNLLVPRRNKEFDLSNLQSKQVPQILYELASEIARAYNFPEPPCFSKNNKTLLDWSW